MVAKLEPRILEKQIIEQGSYDEAERRRIYEKWFSKGPRHQFRAVNHKYHLSEKTICDIGCGFGMNLLYCKDDSYGIEIDKYRVNFARSIGLTVHDIDFMHSNIDHLPKVDAVWCAALLEHVESIHTFLRKISILIKPDGLVVIYVPTIPLIPALRHIPGLERFTTGYLYSDHINAFTPSTLRFFCERAGYETLDISPFMNAPLSIFNNVPLVNRLVDGVTYVGRKIPDWDYPQKATRQASETGNGFEYRHWFGDSAEK